MTCSGIGSISLDFETESPDVGVSHFTDHLNFAGLPLLCGGSSHSTNFCDSMVKSCGFIDGGRRITESLELLQGLASRVVLSDRCRFSIRFSF